MAVMKFRNPDTGEWVTLSVGAGGVTDHGQLSGLTDDDHPQYLLRSGGQMTGPLVVPAPTSPTDAANKAYVDESDSTWTIIRPDDPGDPTLLGNPLGGLNSPLWVDTDDDSWGGGGTGSPVFGGIFGDGVSDTILVTHGLGTEDIVVSLWNANTKELVNTEVTILNVDTLQLNFSIVPPPNTVKVVVMTAGSTGTGGGSQYIYEGSEHPPNLPIGALFFDNDAVPPPSGGVNLAAIGSSTSAVGETGSSGTSDLAARADHVHAGAPPILVLGKTDPVPGGTAAGTIIVRKDA
jgi:hypothetical protein